MSKPAGVARVTRIEFGLCQHVLYLNRSATLWADRNHGDRRFQQLLDTFQVLLRRSRQVFVVANIGCIALPALDLFIDGLAGREVALRSGETVDELAVELIGGANFDGRECIEYIEFCDDGRGPCWCQIRAPACSSPGPPRQRVPWAWGRCLRG